jgi:hypothetical protein
VPKIPSPELDQPLNTQQKAHCCPTTTAPRTSFPKLLRTLRSTHPPSSNPRPPTPALALKPPATQCCLEVKRTCPGNWVGSVDDRRLSPVVRVSENRRLGSVVDSPVRLTLLRPKEPAEVRPSPTYEIGRQKTGYRQLGPKMVPALRTRHLA